MPLETSPITLKLFTSLFFGKAGFTTKPWETLPIVKSNTITCTELLRILKGC